MVEFKVSNRHENLQESVGSSSTGKHKFTHIIAILLLNNVLFSNLQKERNGDNHPGQIFPSSSTSHS